MLASVPAEQQVLAGMLASPNLSKCAGIQIVSENVSILLGRRKKTRFGVIVCSYSTGDRKEKDFTKALSVLIHSGK